MAPEWQIRRLNLCSANLYQAIEFDIWILSLISTYAVILEFHKFALG